METEKISDRQFYLDAGDWLMPDDEANAAELKRLVCRVLEWQDRMDSCSTSFCWQVWHNRTSDLGAFIAKQAKINGLIADRLEADDE